jgi:hypothetical protein
VPKRMGVGATEQDQNSDTTEALGKCARAADTLSNRRSGPGTIRHPGPDRLRLGRRRRSYGGGRLRSFDFPIAILAQAGAEVAALRALLDDKGGAALRARFGDRLVRRGEIAIGVAAATVEDVAATASLR